MANESIRTIVTELQKGLHKLAAAASKLEHDAEVLRRIRGITANGIGAPTATVRGGRPGPKPGPKPTPAKADRKAGTKAKRANAAVQKIVQALQGQGKGLSSTELKTATGLKGGPLTYRLEQLRAQKKVRMEGTKSKARYFLA